jgi:hypothetical protein
MPANERTARRAVAAGIAAVALVAVVGAVALGASRQPSSAPAPSHSPKPSAVPAIPTTPVPATPVPATPAPSDPVGVPPVVVLDTIEPDDPRVAIDDQSGTLVDVHTEPAGDGMSVRWNDSIVEQVGPKTIRVTWVGFPGAEQVVLTITADGGAPVLVFDQKAPYANTDALGADRVLVLSFDRAVDADEVEVAFPSVEASF